MSTDITEIVNDGNVRITRFTIAPPDDTYSLKAVEILDLDVKNFTDQTNRPLNVFTDVANPFHRIVIEDL